MAHIIDLKAKAKDFVDGAAAEAYVRQQWSKYNNNPNTHPEDTMSFLDWCSETGDYIVKDKGFIWNHNSYTFVPVGSGKKRK